MLLAVHISPTFLNTEIADEYFQQSGKQDSSKHILKNSPGMYESSSSQFFRPTSGIQSAPDTSGKSRLILAFFTNLGVAEMQVNFRIVLEEKMPGISRDVKPS